MLAVGKGEGLREQLVGSVVALGSPALPCVDTALLMDPKGLLPLADRPRNLVPAMPAGVGNPWTQGTLGQASAPPLLPRVGLASGSWAWASTIMGPG